MTWFASLSHAIRRGVDGLQGWLRRRVVAPSVGHLRVEYADDFPDFLRPSTVYVAGEAPHYWGVTFLCPCGCGDSIQLNLLEDASPCWSLSVHRDGSLSIEPSVWRSKGCKSHFFVQHNRIEWFKPSKTSRTSVRR